MIDRNAELKISSENLPYLREDLSLRYQKLLEAATDYTYTVMIEDGRPSRTVHSICSFAITGYTPAEYQETPFLWFEMIHEEDRGLVSEHLDNLMAGAEIPSFEHRIIHKDGSIRWARNTVVPHYDTEGKLVEYDALVSDITEARKAAAKTAKINRAYKTLSMCNQAMIRASSEKELLARLCHILTEVGGYALAWVGYARQDTEKSVTVAASEGRDAGYLKELRLSWADTDGHDQEPAGRAIRTGQIVLHDSSLSNSEQTPWQERARQHGYLSSIALPLKAEQEVIGALNLYAGESNAFNRHEIELLSELAEDLSFGIMALRTKKKHAKTVKALATSSMRLQAIFETVQAGIVIIDKESRRIVDANPAARQLIGLSSTKLIGNECYQTICPTDRGQCPVLDMGQHLDNSGQMLLQAGGKKLPILKSVVELELNGRACLLESFLDISKRVEDERERLKLQGQLRQAQKMEAIGTLAGGIAHDFNNILAAIMGYTELALLEVGEGSLRATLTEVRRASGRAKDLVAHILAFSRQGEMARTPVNVAPIIKETLKMLRASLPTTIEIRQTMGHDLGKILADATQIHQVLMNLCTNAAHAMRETGGVLEVELAQKSLREEPVLRTFALEPGNYLRLTVRDTGQGIDPTIVERIFDPFFTTKNRGEGTGLGLSVVHGIVTSHGGGIEVQSAPGQGTIFSLYFPVLERVTETVETVVADAPPTGKERVLFIDDESSLIELGERILVYLGYQVTTRTSSIEALELFRAKPDDFDLVITDYTMPNMTGGELAKHILAIRPEMPIVLCTGFSEVFTEEKAKALGIQGYVMKPISIHDLAKICRGALDHAKENRSRS